MFAARSTVLLLSLLSVLFPFASQAEVALSDDVKDQETAGDVLLIGVPLAALGLTYFLTDEVLKDDGKGGALSFDADSVLWLNGHPRHDLFLAMGRTLLATYTLKYSVSEERPNGNDNHSFPSGHTSVSFAGAEFIRKEYGWGWGVPAYLAASFVGYSRVKAQDHHTIDVLTGATIGVLANHDLQRYITHFGTLSVGPGFSEPHAIVDPAWREENATRIAPAPTLGLSLSF